MTNTSKTSAAAARVATPAQQQRMDRITAEVTANNMSTVAYTWLRGDRIKVTESERSHGPRAIAVIDRFGYFEE